jgi:type I restriction enzyme M protein
LIDGARRHQATIKSEQDAGDAIYWPMFNLDIKNPHSAEALEHLPPEELAEGIAARAERIGELMVEIKDILAAAPNPASTAEVVA